MKYITALVWFLLVFGIACSKNDIDAGNECGCAVANPTCATIVKVVTNCNVFGIEVKGVQYPSSTIPDEFKAVGKKVCVQYTLYDELSTAPCATGTWANITSIASAN